MEEKELRNFIGGKINSLRKRKGITQNELGSLVGVKNNTISAYERGIISTDQDILFRLSDVLGVSIDEFFPHVERVNDSNNEHPYLPTAISAGLPMEVDGITESSKITLADELLGKYKNDQSLFFARASGDSMDKRFKDDALIGIKPLSIEQLNNGDIVVYSDAYDYSVKHYYRYGDTIVFKPDSTNPVHKEHVYNVNDNIMIHGKVVVSVNTYD